LLILARMRFVPMTKSRIAPPENRSVNLLRPLYILASNFYTLSLVVCAAVLATYDILGLVPDFQRFQPIAQSAMRS